MFSKGESVLRKCVMGCGLGFRKAQGLLSKITREGVSAYVSRWIKNGWIRLDLGVEERKSWPEQWLRQRRSMAGGVELAGVISTRAMVHGSMNREHREREGKQANSSRPRARPMVAVGAGAAMAGGVKHVGARGLGSTGHESRK